MRLLTIETESRLGTLWDQEEYNQICSKEEVWEAARDDDNDDLLFVLAETEEMKIPWKEANEGPPVTEEQYQGRFWRRRLDGIELDTITKEFLAIEFKRTRGLQALGQVKGWKLQQRLFAGGTCGSIHVESFNKT